MNSTRLALLFSLATTAAWTAKAVAIGVAGGLGRSPLENPLYLLGLLCCVVASVSTGVAITRRRPLGIRILGGILGFVLVMAMAVVVGAVVTAVEPASPGWVWEEVNLWAIVVTLLAVDLALRSRRTTTAEPVAPVTADAAT